MTLSRYRKTVRYSAIYDLLFTLAFAIPGLAGIKLSLLRTLHYDLALPGQFPTFDGLHLLFVHLLGIVVTVWSLLRIRHPEPRFGLYDSLARFGFSGAMAYTLLFADGSLLIGVFLLPECLWGIYQYLGYKTLSLQPQAEKGAPMRR